MVCFEFYLLEIQTMKASVTERKVLENCVYFMKILR